MKAGVLPKITSALLYIFWNNLKNGDEENSDGIVHVSGICTQYKIIIIKDQNN